jgi:hypothetical protein
MRKRFAPAPTPGDAEREERAEREKREERERAAPRAPQLQAQLQAQAAPSRGYLDAVREVEAIGRSLDTLGELFAAQAEQVAFVEQAAHAAREDVQSGNRELEQAAQRPHALRDAAVALILAMAAALVFLDWQFA